MWTKPGQAVAIDPSQIVEGLYVWLDVSWDDHPFLYNKFKLTDQKQIETLRRLDLAGRLYYYPNKSDAVPAPLAAGTPAAAPVAAPAADAAPLPAAATDASGQAAADKRSRLRQQRDAAARADRAWERAAKAVREGLLGLARTPRQAGEQLSSLSRETASLIAGGQEILLHLLGDKQGEGPQFHALNVMTLSMLIGKTAGLNEAQLADLALGALAHDAGKAGVPQHLLKSGKRQKHEEAFYRQHVALGVKFAGESGAFGAEAQAIIADHHEALNGSGWPSGKAQMGVGARIVALVDRYDRLCSPESPEQEAMMPAEALARLFRLEAGKFDPRLLSLMIRLLGVYPPGTLVHLNDGALGLVVSPGRDSLRPKVLIYSPEMAKEEAPVLDLGEEPGIKIHEALKPSSLPADVIAWLTPRQRLSYFFSAAGNEH